MNHDASLRWTNALLAGCVGGWALPGLAEQPISFSESSPSTQSIVRETQRQNAAAARVLRSTGRASGDLAMNGQSSCATSAQSLCYDYRAGHAVYKPARKLMPDIRGLQRESMSLKRSGITLRYSFK